MSLQQEILNGESRTLEYKVELPEDSEKWVKSIVAFANGAGGKFVVGVNNRREFIVQKMVKTLHFQCSDFQFLKMFG